MEYWSPRLFRGRDEGVDLHNTHTIRVEYMRRVKHSKIFQKYLGLMLRAL